MATIRVDVTGNGVDYSKTVEVDEGREISSIKIDNGSNEIKVNYKKSVSDGNDDGEGRKEVSNEEDSNAAGDVVSEETGSDTDVEASDGIDVKLKARGKAGSGAGTGPKAKVDPDGNTAKVKTDETLPNA